MKQTVHILPLRVTPHSDRTMILNAYSRELGSVSFAVNSGKGPSAARRRALLMPLNPLEVETAVTPGRELLRFGEARALMPLHVVMSSPARSAVAMFLAEALGPILRQGEGEPVVFDYIMEAIGRLNDPKESVANFHLCFLTRLTPLLGIEPDATDYREGMVFDMIDARFRQSAALHGHTLSAGESAVAWNLFRITWENQAMYRFSRAERARALELILEYYTLHHCNLTGLRSPGVLQALLG